MPKSRTSKTPPTSSSRRQQLFAYEHTRMEYERCRSGIATGMHRELVRLALSAGKRVPDRVLSDYPDLLRQHFTLAGSSCSR